MGVFSIGVKKKWNKLEMGYTVCMVGSVVTLEERYVYLRLVLNGLK
jgi:hypothetical protein